jgi:uncharacterized protein
VANRLAREQSPYLLQHKDNPVDWYPWGDEAFEKARREDRPIFLSIGYSTCHWCHVMEHESFENAAIADVLNREFVPIKVDREERPDVDDVYMQAVQMMTGQGGWPLSLFLTPEGRPFYGGTYYPPRSRWGRPGFAELLGAISSAWRSRRDELESSAAEMLGHLESEAKARAAPAAIPAGVLDGVVPALARQFDAENGGFGGAPKFPPAMRLELLLRIWTRTGAAAAREMAERTLTRMAAGGIYDQVGGGFHRYSVDATWTVPHFEKMLYDNAMLARVYALAHRAFGRPEDARVVRETLDYLLREMTPLDGGFFAAQDADSGGEEGTFYVWTPESVAEVVGESEAALVCARFGVTREGNFEHGATVLTLAKSVSELAAELGRSEDEVVAVLADARAKMYEARSKRVAPATDDKQLTDWTGLAISAFALAGRILREPRYVDAAGAAAERVLRECVRGGELLHRSRGGSAAIPGFATDYAFFAEALLDLYEATFEPRYLSEALRLQRALDERFADPRGGYFLTSEASAGLIVRPRETFDGATPSSNSVAASNLLRIAALTGDEKARERADAIFSAFAGLMPHAPSAFPRLLCALDFREDAALEVVLAGEPGRADFDALWDASFASPRLNRVLARAESAEEVPELAALAEGRASRGGPARAYVCERFACRAPVDRPDELVEALDPRRNISVG